MKNFFTLLTMFWLSSLLGQTTLSQKANSHLLAQAEQWGLSTEDINSSMVSDQYTSEEGITYMYYQQLKDGIPIYQAINTVAIDSKGSVHLGANRFLNLAVIPSTSATQTTQIQAVESLAKEVGIYNKEDLKYVSKSPEKSVIAQPSYANSDIEVSPVFYFDGSKLIKSWSLAIDEKEDADYYLGLIDQGTGLVLNKHNYTVYCSFDHDHGHSAGKPHTHSLKDAAKSSISAANTYNVYAYPTESPIHGPQVTLNAPWDTKASPFGWHDTNGEEGAEYTITRGNNVHAYLDLNDQDQSVGGEPDGGAELNFDFNHDDSLDPTESKEVAQVNLFYAVNRLHDVTYNLGFNEAAGNFQVNNYGNAGNGGDQVQAQAFDGFELATPKLNNANFSTPSDGSSGRMQMFLWDNSSGAVKIESPEELAGFVSPYGTARFGDPIPTVDNDPITGKLVIAKDGSAQDETTVCNEIVNADEVNGNIAIIDRGLCLFTEKVQNAQDAGAIAVVICNIAGAGGDGEEVINLGGESTTITIPSIMIQKSTCDRIKASIRSDIDVTLTLHEPQALTKKYLDGSLDNGIIAHEFGHGVSNRLIGGPSATFCLSSEEQAGEGISDFMTLLMTVEEGDTRNDERGIGNYASARNASGRGIRQYPYSCDLAINPLTYDDLKSINTSQEGFIYPVGEIWTSMLWEMYWNLVDQYGLDTSFNDEESGNFITGKLFIEGMKMSPCNPSFIEARNSILKADTMLYDGKHSGDIWSAFAKRGLGYYATDQGSGSIKDGTSSYEVHPLSIKKLKVSKSFPDLVKANETITVTLEVANHIPENVTGIRVEDMLGEYLAYEEGSASVPATLDGDVLTFDVGSLDYKETKTITYRVRTVEGAQSQTLYFQDLEDIDIVDWDREVLEGNAIWRHSNDISNSEEFSWYISSEADSETDATLITEELDLTAGERPVLKFWHRFDTEASVDGGFLQISTDSKSTWTTLYADAFLRNGYNTGIDYSTFAIPSLDGYTGSSDSKYIDSYIDLSPYKGKKVFIRFRYGTNEENGVDAEIEFPGWSIDDLEVVDLSGTTTMACIYSGDKENLNCSPIQNVIFRSTNDVNDVEDIENVGKVAISPNPAKDYVSIDIQHEAFRNAAIQLYNTNGSLLETIIIPNSSNRVTRSIATTKYAAGMYYIRIVNNNGSVVKKLIIQ